MSVIVGIDVGATTIAGGLVTDRGEILLAVRRGTASGGAGRAVETLLDITDELVAQAGRRGLRLDGVGIGLPGLVNFEKGMMVDESNFVPEFVHVPLAESVGARTGVPAFIDNDVNVLALGEWTFGAARGVASVVVIALGTGTGGGIILDDRLVRGHVGSAGEFGHVPFDPDGPACFCGSRGCLCLYLSGRGLATEARRQAAADPASRLWTLAGREPAAITAPLLFEAAAGGDALARRLVEEACHALGTAIAMSINILNPALVLVTGGVAGSLLPLQEEVVRRARERTLAHSFAATRIQILPGDKGQTMRGGAALVLYEIARRGGPARD